MSDNPAATTVVNGYAVVVPELDENGAYSGCMLYGPYSSRDEAEQARELLSENHEDETVEWLFGKRITVTHRVFVTRLYPAPIPGAGFR